GFAERCLGVLPNVLPLPAKVVRGDTHGGSSVANRAGCSAGPGIAVYNWEEVFGMQTILVIDDDESLRDTIGLMLEKEGFRPILVADGVAGLEQAFSAKPHLILIDLRMPGLSGVDVCKRLRASGAKTPVIVLSALGDEIDKVL